MNATPGPGRIDVTWEAVNGATSYRVVAKAGATEVVRTVPAPTTEKTISDLDPAKTYSITVAAVNAIGTSSTAAGPDVRPDELPFSPPSDFRSTSRTSTSVALAWTKVPGAVKYVISSGTGDEPRTSQAVGDVASATVSGLSASTEYSFDITAVKSDNTESAASSRITDTTSAAPAPDRPTDLRWTYRSSTSITVEWTKKPGAVGYRIYSGIGTGTRTRMDVGDVSKATITGLTRGAEYSIDMVAVERNGTRSPYTPRLTARTSSLLPPKSVARKASTRTTITVKWIKASGANGYRISYSTGGGAAKSINIGGGSTQSGQITGLTRGKTYSIHVASLEGDWDSRSSYSPRISVKTSP